MQLHETVARNTWLAQLRIQNVQPDDAGYYTVQLRLYGGDCRVRRTVQLRLHKPTHIRMPAIFDGMAMMWMNRSETLQCNVSAYPLPTVVRWSWSECRTQAASNEMTCDNATVVPEVARESHNSTFLVSSVTVRPTTHGRITCTAGDAVRSMSVLVRRPPDATRPHVDDVGGASTVRVETVANVRLRCDGDRAVFRHLQWERAGRLVMPGLIDGVTIDNRSSATHVAYDLHVVGKDAAEVQLYTCALQCRNDTTVFRTFVVVPLDGWVLYLCSAVVAAVLLLAVCSSLVFYYSGVSGTRGLMMKRSTICRRCLARRESRTKRFNSLGWII